MSKFTVKSGKVFDRLVKKQLEIAVKRCLDLPGSKLVKAIILMGSYGRGEGTALQTSTGLKPFNDYDLVVVGKRMTEFRRRRFQKVLKKLEEEVSEELGITVDYFLHTVNSLKRADSSLMNYEMKNGHMVLYGAENILDIMPDYKAVPLREATRLLLNRGKLLLDIQCTLNEYKCIPARFNLLYRKFLNKMVLAIGDSALLAFDKYDISYLEKRNLIASTHGMKSSYWLMREYKRAVDFKLSGDQSFLPEDVEAYFYETKEYFAHFYYWLESKRLGDEIENYSKYWRVINSTKINKNFKQKARNFIVNVKEFGIEALKSPRWLLRHPRERLFAVFPILLKSKITEWEADLIHILEGCEGRLNNGITKFYSLRNFYL